MVLSSGIPGDVSIYFFHLFFFIDCHSLLWNFCFIFRFCVLKFEFFLGVSRFEDLYYLRTSLAVTMNEKEVGISLQKKDKREKEKLNNFFQRLNPIFEN